MGTTGNLQPKPVTSLPLRGSNRPLRILVAEVNAVNHKIAQRVLEEKGHEVTIACNGQEALRLLGGASFDLVFMDIKMLEMDGLSATAVLREQERETGRHIPIIAMTANAIAGDRERCLAAGMDGCVATPLRMVEIEEAISSALDQEEYCSEAVPLYWDRSTILENMGGDEILLNEVVQLFLAESPKLVTRMEQALLQHDPRMLELAAHCLRGELGYLGAPQASEAAQKLEDAGRTGAMEAAPDLLAGLRIRLAALWAAVGKDPSS